eukprot:764376-Hanusia_phi.AAC.1
MSDMALIFCTLFLSNIALIISLIPSHCMPSHISPCSSTFSSPCASSFLAASCEIAASSRGWKTSSAAVGSRSRCRC